MQNIIGKRIAFLRNTKKGQKRSHMSQDELADAMKYSRSQIQRFEDGRSIPGDTTLLLFAKYFGTTVDYLKGITDIKDPILYCNYLDECEFEGLIAYEEEEMAAIERLKIMFFMCGYTYENISRQGFYMFQDFSKSAERYNGPHKLSDPAGINETVYLTDLELEDLKKQLGRTIAYECYRIAREGKNLDGNS